MIVLRCGSERAMRVMVLVKATQDSERGTLPTADAFEAMGKFNEQLASAGILRAAGGFQAFVVRQAR